MAPYPEPEVVKEVYDLLEQIGTTYSCDAEFSRSRSEEKERDCSERAIPAVYDLNGDTLDVFTFNKVTEKTGFVIKQIGGSRDTDEDQCVVFFRKLESEVIEDTVNVEVNAEVAYTDPDTGEKVTEETTKEVEKTKERVEFSVR